MELIGHILLAMFIALIVFTAFSAGIVLLMWFVSLAVVLSILVMMRNVFRRWWFLYHARDKHYPQNPPKVIETEYRDISDE